MDDVSGRYTLFSSSSTTPPPPGLGGGGFRSPSAGAFEPFAVYSAAIRVRGLYISWLSELSKARGSGGEEGWNHCGSYPSRPSPHLESFPQKRTALRLDLLRDYPVTHVRSDALVNTSGQYTPVSDPKEQLNRRTGMDLYVASFHIAKLPPFAEIDDVVEDEIFQGVPPDGGAKEDRIEEKERGESRLRKWNNTYDSS
ncbi:hypothetical protein KM043_011148 [Ampulex compressa]|nr:hypothetical protein KM043_011148 [Ampulex compressa]